MKRTATGGLRRLGHWLLSVPIRVKILGIGVVVALVFGVIVLVLFRSHLVSSYSQSLADESRWLVRILATRVERHLITRDRLGIHEAVNSFIGNHPGIGYVVVRDAGGQVVEWSGDQTAPVESMPLLDEIDLQNGRIVQRESGDGGIFESTFPALEGHAGTVTLGLTDHRLREGLASLNRVLALAMCICFILGQALAVLLTWLLTRPLRHLVTAVGRVGEGDLTARATSFYDDEIGGLARALNQMVQRLQEQQALLSRTELERLKLLDQLIFSQEEERARIAREIHDEFGQAMSALLLEVRSGVGASEPCAAHSKALAERIETIVEQAQSFAWSLRPSILDDYGLESALTRHIESIQALSGIAFDFQYVVMDGAPRRLDSRCELVLYRVAQEAITNVIRHSSAARCSVQVVCDRPRVRLIVEDDGCGFDVRADRAQDERTSLGLVGMRERVALLGGDFAIETGPDLGTTLRAAIPLAEENQ